MTILHYSPPKGVTGREKLTFAARILTPGQRRLEIVDATPRYTSHQPHILFTTSRAH